MNSPSAASGKPPSPAPSPSQNASREPSREPPRKQAEARSARERFSARLEQGGERSASGTDKSSLQDASGRDRVGGSGEQSGGSGGSGNGGGPGGDQGGGSQSEYALAQAALGLQFHGVSAITATAAAGAPVLDTAMLERMAAQIAESWPSSGSSSTAQQATVTFPEGAIAHSAHIIRQPDGGMAVRIAGLDPKLAALKHAQLQLQLSGALARRRLKVNSLRFESADQPASGQVFRGGGVSAIPRVV
ncbi:MAG: hypothetical protein WBA51_12680 [Erythrobacter sp.]